MQRDFRKCRTEPPDLQRDSLTVIDKQRRAACPLDERLRIVAPDQQPPLGIVLEARRDRTQRLHEISALSAVRSSLPLGPTGSSSFQMTRCGSMCAGISRRK